MRLIRFICIYRKKQFKFESFIVVISFFSAIFHRYILNIKLYLYADATIYSWDKGQELIN